MEVSDECGGIGGKWREAVNNPYLRAYSCPYCVISKYP